MNGPTTDQPLRPTARQVAVICAILLSGVMTGYYTRLIQTALSDLQGIWGSARIRA